MSEIELARLIDREADGGEMSAAAKLAAGSETREPLDATVVSLANGSGNSSPVLDTVPLLQVPSVPLLRDTGHSAFTDEALERLHQRWGAGDDGYFDCPIPNHTGRALLIFEAGGYVLACCQGRSRSLAEVRAAIGYGFDSLRSNIELAIWWRRLAYELGTFEPATVTVPDVPADAPPNVRVTRDGFELLLGLRRADYPPRPVAFSVRFAGAWCDLAHRDAHAAIRALLETAVIVEVDRKGRVRLYEPGATA